MTPVQSECKRCEKLFCYFAHSNSRRLYCSLCVELERLDLLDFRKLQRRKAAVASGRRWPFARFPAGSLIDQQVST